MSRTIVICDVCREGSFGRYLRESLNRLVELRRREEEIKSLTKTIANRDDAVEHLARRAEAAEKRVAELEAQVRCCLGYLGRLRHGRRPSPTELLAHWNQARRALDGVPDKGGYVECDCKHCRAVARALEREVKDVGVANKSSGDTFG